MVLRIDRRVMLALFATLASGPVLHADTDNWGNVAGGAYSTAGNWSLNAPPGGGDLADFALNDPYSVSFLANATASQLLVDSGQVTFNLGGHTANFTSFSNVPTNESVAVAQSANSTASLTISNGTLSGIYGSIGTSTQNAQAFGNGTLNVTAGGHVVFHNALAPANALNIGEQGSGTLNISGGGTANVDDLYVAAGLSDGSVAAKGQVNLSGAGSSMTVNSQVFMAYYPNTVANMTVQNSASATSNQFYIGYDQGRPA